MLKVLASTAVALAVVFSAQAQVNSSALKWGPAPAAFPAGAQMTVLAGDPSKSGMFVLRLKTPPGYKIPAHHHSTDEYVTVITGDLHLGMGDRLDKSKSALLSAGGFAMAPAHMNHFAWTEGGAVVQVQAIGPFQVDYVNSKDDPTHH